ncbi:MAG TPA: hypothetical protein VFX96_12565 [Pyrinomonadaceae bacterium]|nr:hypothetical protein [Pyrinomonadaceae bacterium]
MNQRNRTRGLASASLALALALTLWAAPAAVGAQDKSEDKKSDDKKAKFVPPSDAQAVLWRDPGDISSRDLLNGPGGETGKPDVSNLTFVEWDNTGFSLGVRVRDGAGRTWVGKIGKEAQPETAASRLLWAAGYMTEIHYLFPCVQIKGATEPPKKVERCEGNGFTNVRFEARPEGVKRLDEWTWAQNPFANTKEFRALILMMAFINNWDLKDSNNKVIYVPASGGAGSGELHYIISDLGATFGKTGGFISRNRNAPKDYAKAKFIEGVEGGRVRINYGGKNKGLMDQVGVEDAAWLGRLLSQLSDKQIADAFRAANFTDEEVQLLAGAVRTRINQLTSLGGGATATSQTRE